MIAGVAMWLFKNSELTALLGGFKSVLDGY